MPVPRWSLPCYEEISWDMACCAVMPHGHQVVHQDSWAIGWEVWQAGTVLWLWVRDDGSSTALCSSECCFQC